VLGKEPPKVIEGVRKIRPAVTAEVHKEKKDIESA
jgi:hypothetical protein